MQTYSEKELLKKRERPGASGWFDLWVARGKIYKRERERGCIEE